MSSPDDLHSRGATSVPVQTVIRRPLAALRHAETPNALRDFSRAWEISLDAGWTRDHVSAGASGSSTSALGGNPHDVLRTAMDPRRSPRRGGLCAASAHDVRGDTKVSEDRLRFSPRALYRGLLDRARSTGRPRPASCPSRGPASFLSDKKLRLAEGDTLAVLGSRVMIGDKAVVLARELTKGETTVKLPDESGRSLWRRGRT